MYSNTYGPWKKCVNFFSLHCLGVSLGLFSIAYIFFLCIYMENLSYWSEVKGLTGMVYLIFLYSISRVVTGVSSLRR